MKQSQNFNFSPEHRLRRLRGTPTLRDIVRETSLSPRDLVYPIFVTEEARPTRTPILSMPAQDRVSLGALPEAVENLSKRGVRSFLLFGIPNEKDAVASSAIEQDGVIQQAVRICKEVAPNVLCMTDVCVCEFTDHGHCGIIKDGTVDNDLSIELLAKMALSHARAGADLIAPSAMMDFQVGAIRQALDEEGFTDLPIMGYSAKFASGFYGPFREAAGSAPQFGDRRGYQMDSANGREALREIRADIEQGADIIMVKPALAYLDIVRQARDTFDQPLAVYNVSGEYAMVKAAAMNGWIDERTIVLEMLTGFKRAGADIIISYFTPEVIDWIR